MARGRTAAAGTTARRRRVNQEVQPAPAPPPPPPAPAAPAPRKRPPRRTRGKPNHMDHHVGLRVRQRRTLLGMSQTKLAEALNLTFQQIQKYERGANRVGAGRLFDLARVLQVPVQYFFDDAEPGEDAGASPANGQSDRMDDPMARRETLQLVRAYYAVPEHLRRRVFELLRSLAPDEKAA